jgi:2-C-methyl-D-erythritol 4-phosphate cytidylyltransferase
MNVSPVPNEIVWTIVVAAGSGNRFGGQKQFMVLGDKRVIDWSRDVAHSIGDGVDVADAEGGVAGGATRSESVRRGLAAVPSEATIICVQDAARPFASEHLYKEVISAVAGGADGAVPGLPVTDTIKRVDNGGQVLDTPDRASLVAVQTPQAFRASVLRMAHESGTEGTDDASLVERAGGKVVVVNGEAINKKLTSPEDLEWARAMAATEI